MKYIVVGWQTYIGIEKIRQVESPKICIQHRIITENIFGTLYSLKQLQSRSNKIVL